MTGNIGQAARKRKILRVLTEEKGAPEKECDSRLLSDLTICFHTSSKLSTLSLTFQARVHLILNEILRGLKQG